jgi:hypothetical protein
MISNRSRSATLSSTPSMICLTAFSCAAKRSGVKALITSALSRSCRGGSIEIICSRCRSGSTPMASTLKMPRRSEEKVR